MLCFHKYRILLSLKICLGVCFQNHNPPVVEIMTDSRNPRKGWKSYVDQCFYFFLNTEQCLSDTSEEEKKPLSPITEQSNSRKTEIPVFTLTVTAPIIWGIHNIKKCICQISSSKLNLKVLNVLFLLKPMRFYVGIYPESSPSIILSKVRNIGSGEINPFFILRNELDICKSLH